MTVVRLAAIRLGGTSDPWAALGFSVDADGAVPLANGALVFDDATTGMTGLEIADWPAPSSGAADVDGVSVTAGDIRPALSHRNGATELDHVVVMTDSLERTGDAIEATLGLACKRIRETEVVRQGFHRFADEAAARGCIIEVVENAKVKETALFGLVVIVTDLHAMCAELGSDVISEPKPAVQPGRFIATVRQEVGLPTRVAFMS